MNIQELQTVIGYKLPIKLFVLNNNGYLSIRQTQDSFFNGRHVGCDPESGVTFPDIIKVARAYGFHVEKIDNHAKMKPVIKRVLSRKGAVVCEVVLSKEQKFSPRVSSRKMPDGRMVSKPLEDMYPFLDRDEFLKNMLIKPLPE
jgi:acetolactate synthase-1/2/3 large subunit